MIVSEICPVCKKESIDTNCGVDYTWKPHTNGGGEPCGMIYYCATCWNNLTTHANKLEAIRKLEALSFEDGTTEEILATFVDSDVQQLLCEEIIPRWLWSQEL